MLNELEFIGEKQADPQVMHLALIRNSIGSLINALREEGSKERNLTVVDTLLALESSIEALSNDVRGVDSRKDIQALKTALEAQTADLKTALLQNQQQTDVRLSKEDIKALTPKEVKIPAFPKIPAPLKAVEVSNYKDTIPELKKLNDTVKRLLQKEAVESVKISNISDIKIPEQAQFPQEALDALKHLSKLSQDPESPLSVRLSDGNEFYKAIDAFVQAVGTGGSMSFRDSAGASTKALVDSTGVAFTRSRIGASATNTFATIGTSSTTVIAANSNRISLTLVNDSTNKMYVSKGSAAVSGSGILLNASGGSLIIDDYAGDIYAIATGAGSNLTVSEVY